MRTFYLSELVDYCRHYGVRVVGNNYQPLGTDGQVMGLRFERDPGLTPDPTVPDPSVERGMTLSVARTVAAEIVGALSKACNRIEVAGSVRRNKTTGIKDIEIVAIPCGEELHRLTDSMLTGQLSHRLDKAGRKSWGMLSRRALWHSPHGDVALDLHITTSAGWGVIYTLRTGDADFSRALVTQRGRFVINESNQRVPGLLPVGMRVHQTYVWGENGDMLNTPEEHDVFAALGIPFIEPAERTLSTAKKLVRVK